MRKVLLLIASSILSILFYTAYGETPDGFSISDGNRKSISFITVRHGDIYDSYLQAAISEYMGRVKRYDYNEIPTKTVGRNSVESVETLNGIAKEVLRFWFRGGRVTDDSRIIERSRHNASDQDVLIGNASKIGSGVYEQTYDLIGNSYVVFVEYAGFSKALLPVGVKLKITLYRLAVSVDGLFEDGKVMKYNNVSLYPVGLSFRDCSYYSFDMGIFSGLDERDVTLRCMLHCLEEALGGNGPEAGSGSLSSELTAVTGTVYSSFPVIKAKLGEKQSVKNGDRYKVVVYSEDMIGRKKNSSVGYIRATTVRNNLGQSDGNSPASCFYRISGKVPAGSTIISDKNRIWSYSLGIGQYITDGYFEYDDVYGRIEYGDPTYRLTFKDPMVYLSARRLLNINRLGISQYFLAESWLLFSEYADGIFDLDLGADVTIGYGIGLRLAHVFEIMPFVKLGTSSEWQGEIPVILRAGARLSLNLRYPFGIYAQIENYDFLSLSGDSLLSVGVHLWY